VTEFKGRGLRILIAGGGTGGHLYPALAIKEAIIDKANDAQIQFVGTRHGIEARVLKDRKETLHTLWIAGLKRGSLLQNAATAMKLLVSLIQSRRIIRKFRPHLVIGTGGYVMGPVLFAAQRMGIPTLLQEQNSFPGLTTRKLAPKADAVCTAFKDAENRMQARRIELTGNPVRKAFRLTDKVQALESLKLDKDRKTLLFVGGSQGAKSINRTVGDALDALLKHYNVVWQTGSFGVPESVPTSLIESETQQNHLRVLPFIEKMETAYAAADLAICRAGAMTIAELTICGLPAIFIPFPYATDDHQTANAKSLCDAGAASMIKDSDLNASSLLAEIHRILESPDLQITMRASMSRLAKPDAAKRIADIALNLIKL
jgi:UDP-N-acetylglucosamine--N-acetylmuramyl-(pentapeptide) pyrophosphoryl-undecaprenol N-acetylglucosamine transferase